jgi:hypothetical protein
MAYDVLVDGKVTVYTCPEGSARYRVTVEEL